MSVALVTLGVSIPMGAASAAGTASVSISSDGTPVAAGAATTLTLSLSCSVTGGCAGTTLTVPVTSYTDLKGATVNNATAFGALSCPGWTKTTSASTVTYTYTGGTPAGTVPTGTQQCTFNYTTTNYTTPDNQTFPITPTINGSNFTSAAGNTTTVTVTAAEDVTFKKTAPAQVGQGGQYVYDIHFDCTPPHTTFGAIGTSSFTVVDHLPPNFTYQSYQTIYNANNGNYSVGTFPGTVTYDAANNTLTYSDPDGNICNGVSSGAPGRDIDITGTASTAGALDNIGDTISNTATASFTYFDGTSQNLQGTANTNVVAVVPTTFDSKSSSSNSFGNSGQYTYPPNGGRYPYVYPGDWDGSGVDAQYSINLFTNGTQAGADFAVQDPLPCTTNNATPGTATNPNYSSNAPGTLCATPAFIPTVITAAGFAPTTADSITVIHTDGTTASVSYATGTGWIVPTSPAVSEIDFPQFPEEGQNTATMQQFIVKGYAASGLTTSSLITNTATATPYLVIGSDTPLAAAKPTSASLLVVAANSPSGTVVAPGIWPRYNGGSTCTEAVGIGGFGGNGPQSNYIEVAQAPSQAIYLSYLAPQDTTVTAGTAQTFTFTPQEFSAFPSTAGGAVATTATISATVTANYNGTGRQLLQWVIPAGTITAAGDYVFSGSTLTVNLGAGCAGTYQNDVTVGYGAPITSCYGPSGLTVPSNGTNAALETTNAPTSTNYCGESQNIVVSPINPAFSVDKSVQGNLDSTPVTAGGIGNVSPNGGTATYNVTFTNTGSTNLVNPVMYDLLPAVGDTDTTKTDARGSQFGVALTGVGPVPAGVTVSYSQAANPCRPEVLANAGNPGCVDDWSTTAPASLSSVTALEFSYNGTVFVPDSAGINTFSVPYTVSTPANIAGKTAWNTVGTTATPGVGQPLMTAAESSVTGLHAQAGLTVVKAASPTTVDHVGQTVTFTFTVDNDTAVALNAVSINDVQNSPAGALTSGPTCPSPSLAPGATEDCTATYTVTQADLDNGSISDSATASGTPVSGSPLVSAPSTATVTATQTPALTLLKSATPTTVSNAGDKVTYSFLVTNTGNVTATGLAIADDGFSGSGSLSAITCPTTTLAPNADTTCTATYSLTQADADAGSITNTAHATATDAGGAAVASAPSTATVTVTQAPALSLVKSADPSGAAAFLAGQVLTYHYLVTNTGDVTVTNVGITEGIFTGSGSLSDISCPSTTLAPNAQVDCTATYTLSQADIDGGSVSNTATATGTGPGATPVSSQPSTVSTPAIAAPALTLTKSASPTTVSAPGDQVTYSFLVSNAGNVTVTGVGIVEGSFSGTGTLSDISCPDSALVPGQDTTCTATYGATQADIDAGSVTNTASATALAPGGAPVTSPSSSATVTATQAPGLEIAKTVDPTAVDAAGQTVTYTFAVTNTGNATLNQLAVSDTDFSGSGTLSAISCPTTTLAPGDNVSCSATYVVTQEDMDSGSVTNTATATGVDTAGATVTSDPSEATFTVTAQPALTLVKTAQATTTDSEAGQQVEYDFLITNTGNVTVADVTSEEDTFTGTGTLDSPTCPTGAASLAPGAQVTCTIVYTVTQADVDAGSITNTATAVGTPAGSQTPVTSDPSTATVTEPAAAAVTLVKTANVTSLSKAGQVVTFSFTVTNTGNITLENPAVEEGTFNGHGKLSAPTCPTGVTELTPGQVEVCTADYTVVASDLTGDPLTNTATVDAAAPDGDPIVSDPSTVNIAEVLPAGTSPSSTPSPTATASGLADTGSTIAWGYGVLALALVAAGAVILIIRRRRRSA
ncbi:hypothetical protein GCM10027568_34410 [Humibacter soli]